MEEKVYYSPETGDLYLVEDLHFIDSLIIWHPTYGGALISQEQINNNLLYIGDL